MDVCGEARNIQRSHLLKLAEQGGLDVRWASLTIDRLLAVSASFANRAKAHAIRPVTRKHLADRIAENAKRVGAVG